MAPLRSAPAWRWGQLARSIDLDPREQVVLALSGGADSVLLLHVLACAQEQPLRGAVHVDHGLRGAESDEDARFCSRLCGELGVPFVRRRINLGGRGGSLEARAREARYRVLLEETRALGARTLVTGHHADDALETVLLRWMRGTRLGGLSGPRRILEIEPRDPLGCPLRVARPLIALRREEVRALLEETRIPWREDSSNRDPRFARNRVRHLLLPRLRELGGSTCVDNLRAFAEAVEGLERRLAAATAHLAWRPAATAPATRPAACAHLGGTLARGDLERLPFALRRRALWRLLREGTGRSPSRALLAVLLSDLDGGRCARHALPLGWSLQLRTAELRLEPPAALLSSRSQPALRARQGILFRASERGSGAPLPPEGEPTWTLPVPGEVALPDGRRLCADLVDRAPGSDPPRGRLHVELDPSPLCGALPDELAVRMPRPGDRFHPLGAPGSRPLVRFLADEGIPRQERSRVPLVVSGSAILWAAGLRPAEGARVGPLARKRLRLRLECAPRSARAEDESDAQRAGGEPAARHSARQLELWSPRR